MAQYKALLQQSYYGQQHTTTSRYHKGKKLKYSKYHRQKYTFWYWNLKAWLDGELVSLLLDAIGHKKMNILSLIQQQHGT